MRQLLYKGQPTHDYDAISSLLVMASSFAQHLVEKLFVPEGLDEAAKHKFCDVYKEFCSNLRTAENVFAVELMGATKKHTDNKHAMKEAYAKAFANKAERYQLAEQTFVRKMQELSDETGVYLPERDFSWQ